MKIHTQVVAVALLSTVLLFSCKKNDTPLPPSLTTTTNTPIEIESNLNLASTATYKWSVLSKDSELYSLSGETESHVTLIAVQSGDYTLKVVAQHDGKTYTDEITVSITAPAKEQSQYIAAVYDYLPAVGQFVNKLPEYQAGNSKADMISKAEQYLVGKKNGGLVSLGGFGGYIVFGFDHTIANVSGRRDFRVMGNAFYAIGSTTGGSCEPGIIMVAYDANQNGVPDTDEWYEIAGSEYRKPTTIKNYLITYYRPDSENPTDVQKYIRWDDNQNNSGYKVKNEYHTQSYFALWIGENRISFSGTLLPPNGVDMSGNGTNWVQTAYQYGYADNIPNGDDNSAIDIDWAVNSSGQRVKLPGIDFVKVYTGINQECGWIGETSTEIAGAYDLHLAGENVATIEQ